jgi:putative FmdB family regulatory protein
MPTYDYVCENCGHRFEKFQMMSASLLRKCPECSKMKLRRLIGTGAGIIFKGNGFYETDYRSESYKQGQTSEQKPTADAPADKNAPSKSDAAKVETKPDTKTPDLPAKSAKPA